jgi:hydrogenase maturation protease
VSDAARAVVIGVGNEYRRDDGVGPAVLAELSALDLDGLGDVAFVACDGEPTQLFDAWSDVPLAVVIDAVMCTPSTPGRVHRTTLAGEIPVSAASTHGLGIPEAVRLGQALDRVPGQLVVFAVEAADIGFGVGLTDAVAAAVPSVVQAVRAELAAR